jgi:hypothetical protein
MRKQSPKHPFPSPELNFRKDDSTKTDTRDAIEKARIALDHEIANKALAGDEAARKALERMNKSH